MVQQVTTHEILQNKKKPSPPIKPQALTAKDLTDPNEQPNWAMDSMEIEKLQKGNPRCKTATRLPKTVTVLTNIWVLVDANILESVQAVI